jgi:hypothetical protein
MNMNELSKYQVGVEENKQEFQSLPKKSQLSKGMDGKIVVFNGDFLLSGSPLTVNDQVDYLMSKSHFKQGFDLATSVANDKEISVRSKQLAAKNYLNYLVGMSLNSEKVYEELFHRIIGYLPTQPCPWPGLVDSYTTHGRLHKLLPYLPLNREKLSKSDFTRITLKCIGEIGINQFLKILPNTSVEWANLVDQNEIIEKFESGEASDEFGESLATHIYLSELYLLDGRFQDCFKVQLLNKSELCFETIQRYNLDSKIVLENLDNLQEVSAKKNVPTSFKPRRLDPTCTRSGVHERRRILTRVP